MNSLNIKNYNFLYDDTDDYYAAMERREAKRKNALRAILFEEHGAGEITSPTSY